MQSAQPVRNGLSEMSPSDQQNMRRRAIVFGGVKKAAEYAGLRPTRMTLHTGRSLSSSSSWADAVPPGAKLLLLVRHGEGEHNAWRAAEQAAGRTPTAKRHNIGQYPSSLHDPLLTGKGHADAAAAAVTAKSLPQPELLVTSPMRRAVQTLLTVFDEAVSARGDGLVATAHELCREAFHGTDPSIYDSRLSRDALAAAFPRVDFETHVLPSDSATADGTPTIHDPLWWHCRSPFGCGGENGIDEAAIAEHAYRFLQWLMLRPEKVVAVASHCNFLLALHHACLDGCPETPQVFHTGELRALIVSAAPASPVSVRAALGHQLG